MIDLLVLSTLLLLGYFFGHMAERRHYKRIFRQERELMHIPVVTMRTPPQSLLIQEAQLVSGNVVISLDFFKRILASLRNIFGGRVTSLESLLDRARREAVIRMKLQAINTGATQIYNMRLETSSIVKSAGSVMGSVEVLAYGTALVEKASIEQDIVEQQTVMSNDSDHAKSLL